MKQLRQRSRFPNSTGSALYPGPARRRSRRHGYHFQRAGFVQFSKQCTRDTWSRGITVELTADLDLSDQAITPVPIFQGTFHGNGHTISGLSLETKGSKMGLFRTLSASAVVEDLTVEGTLCPQGSANQAGLLAGENFGTVRRCTVWGSVTGQEAIGGLVGYNGESGQSHLLFQ